MRRHPLFLLLLGSIFLPACAQKTKPPEFFPGYESAAADSLATIRESDNVFLMSVDRQKRATDFSFLKDREDYRQFQIPAGTHVLGIWFNRGSLHSQQLQYMPAKLEPGHTYSFASNIDKFFLTFGGATTAKWRPILLDDMAGQPATTMPATAPAGQ